MKDFTDMRGNERTEFDTPVVFSNDNLETHQKAMMYNFSDNGMYFESSEPLRPGSEVFVKTVEYCSINKCRVRWCGRINDDDQEKFGIGLQCEI
jgi:hypothetical protein